MHVYLATLDVDMFLIDAASDEYPFAPISGVVGVFASLEAGMKGCEKYAADNDLEEHLGRESYDLPVSDFETKTVYKTAWECEEHSAWSGGFTVNRMEVQGGESDA